MGRPPKKLLSQQKLIDGAVELIDEHGLEEFTMPRLASSLGVRTSSLYRYFADRAQLLTAVAQSVTAVDEPPKVPPPGPGWTEFLMAQAMGLRKRILRHPNCAPLIVQYMPKTGVFGEFELMCQYLAAAGVPSTFHVRIIDCLTLMAVGSGFLIESCADYAPQGSGPTPDPELYPAMTQALVAVDGSTADELFIDFMQTFLRTIVAEIADSG
jgi:TetR/AcrR family transcriptional regulator, tetracycline repressor protein